MMLCVGTWGCSLPRLTSDQSSLTARSHGDDEVQLRGQFDHAVYSYGDRDSLTVVLIDGPLDQPRQAVTVRMFWLPRAGSTPLTATATNASIQYVVFPPASGDSGGNIGVYSGAGFLYPSNRPGSEHFRGKIWQANLRLSDRGATFSDRLGPSVLTGTINARRDDQAVVDLLQRLNKLVAERLGYPRLVRVDR